MLCMCCSVSIGAIGFVLNSGNVESSSVHLSKGFVCYLNLNNKIEDLVIFHCIRLFYAFASL